MSRARIVIFITAVLLVAGLPLGAQGLSGSVSASFKLTFNVNVPNATIFVDGAQIRGTTINVKAGTHTIKVTADGYTDFEQSVNVRTGMTINATLKSRGYLVTISSNVANPVVFVDGAQIAGTSAVLQPGNHSIRITANGFLDFVSTVNVTGPMTVKAQLNSAGHQVTIDVGVPGALIFIDGAQIAGNAVMLLPGNHSVRVTASGYMDYVTTVNVTGPIALHAQLKSAGYQVTINTNVINPEITVDGVLIAGNSVVLLPGNHSLRITAQGYQDYNTTLKVAGPMQVNAQLAITGHLLTVTSDVRGASVSINNAVKGTVPYSEYLPPGTYMIAVAAPGYMNYVTSVALNGPMTVNAQLVSSAPATVSFTFPREFLDKNNRDPHGQIKIYVDGKMVSARGDARSISVQPGQHIIEVTSGGLTVQTVTFEFAPGARYTVELFMELQVKAVPAN